MLRNTQHMNCIGTGIVLGHGRLETESKQKGRSDEQPDANLKTQDVVFLTRSGWLKLVAARRAGRLEPPVTQR